MFFSVRVWKMWGWCPSSEITIILLFWLGCFSLLWTHWVAGYSKISTAAETKVHLLTHGSKFWYVHQIKKTGSYNMISQYKIYTIFIYYFLLLVCTWSESLFVICLIHIWWFLKAEEHLQSQLHKRKEKMYWATFSSDPHCWSNLTRILTDTQTRLQQLHCDE